MTTTNLNATASQLAIDASYYEQKANECWEILNSIDNCHTEYGRFENSTDSNNCLTFAVHVGPTSYYRSKYAKAIEQLQLLKSTYPDNSVKTGDLR